MIRICPLPPPAPRARITFATTSSGSTWSISFCPAQDTTSHTYQTFRVCLRVACVDVCSLNKCMHR